MVKENKSGQKVAYIRISTDKQNTERQRHALKDFEFDEVFEETASGKSMKSRPKLAELIKYVREGDEVYVYSISRIARNIIDLHKIAEQLNEKGASLHLIKEGKTISKASQRAEDKLFINILASFAEFERDIISERTIEGLQAATAKGKVLGRKVKLSPEQMIEVKKRKADGVTLSRLASDYECSRDLIWRITAGKLDDYITKYKS